MQQERNYSLDLLKIILAFLVVLHHSPSPIHDIMWPITSCAVPSFFMISGYFLFGKEISYNRMMKRAIRITKIFCWSLLIFYICFWVRHEEPYIPNLKDICLLVFVNSVPFGLHLWYLTAYIYALIILAILARKNKILWFGYISIVGLLLYFMLDIWHIYYNVPRFLTLIYCTRNFFFTAIPMMSLGAMVSNWKPDSGKTKWIVASLIVFSICAVIEANTFHLNNHIGDYFFFTIPVSFSLLMLFLNCEIRKQNVLAKWGARYSLFIYLLHPIMISILAYQVGRDTYFVGVLAFTISLLVSVVFVACKNNVKSVIIKHK